MYASWHYPASFFLFLPFARKSIDPLKIQKELEQSGESLCLLSHLAPFSLLVLVVLKKVVSAANLSNAPSAKSKVPPCFHQCIPQGVIDITILFVLCFMDMVNYYLAASPLL